jgi:hypothetical protein
MAAMLTKFMSTDVDTQGLLIHAIVYAANIQGRDGGVLVMATMFGMYPFLMKTLQFPKSDSHHGSARYRSPIWITNYVEYREGRQMSGKLSSPQLRPSRRYRHSTAGICTCSPGFGANGKLA